MKVWQQNQQFKLKMEEPQLARCVILTCSIHSYEYAPPLGAPSFQFETMVMRIL
jgi:hypothetical protein